MKETIVDYEIHYFNSNGIGFSGSTDIPWIDSYDDMKEAIIHAKELVEEGYADVKVMKRSVIFEEVNYEY